MHWSNVCEIHVHNTSSEKEYVLLRLDKYGTLAKTLTPIWPLLSTSNSILRISPTGFRGEKLLLVASADIYVESTHVYVCVISARIQEDSGRIVWTHLQRHPDNFQRTNFHLRASGVGPAILEQTISSTTSSCPSLRDPLLLHSAEDIYAQA